MSESQEFNFIIGQAMPSNYEDLSGKLFHYSRLSLPFLISNIFSDRKGEIVIEYNYGNWRHYIEINEFNIIKEITWDNGASDPDFYEHPNEFTLHLKI
jgi:hypothetical protein